MSALLSVPGKIKIGAYDWRVAVEAGVDDKCGQADFETQTIRLWQDNITSDNHCVGILLHECLHVIYENAKLDKLKGKKADKEEAIVIGFENGLVSLFRDNPKLLTWIKKGLK